MCIRESACGFARTLKILAAVAFVAPLLTRLIVGSAFYLTGKGKVGNPKEITQFFTGLGIPFPAANAWFVSHLEYIGGMLLMVGLAKRPIAALLGATMVVALQLMAATILGDEFVFGAPPVTHVLIGLLSVSDMNY